MNLILIADDHAVVRQGLKQILADEFPKASFGMASTTAETLEILKTQSWDVLVLDLFMPGTGGMSVLQVVRDTYPGLRVIVLSSAPEEQLGVRVLKAGAHGYLNKQAAPEHLVEAIHTVIKGASYVSSALGSQLAADAARDGRPRHDSLSGREFEVLRMVAIGKSMKEIAFELSLSVKTVRTFHTRILYKLRLQNDVDLVHYALEHQLVAAKLSSGTAPHPPTP